MKKYIFIFLLFSVILIALFSCDNSKPETSGENYDLIKITVDDKTYSTKLNVSDDLGDVVIYDKQFVFDNQGSIKLEGHDGRKLYRVSLDDDMKFIVKGAVEPQDAFIPYNGFIMSFADTSVEIKYNTLLTVENYIPSDVETTAFASFTINGERRRIYLKDPDIPLDDNIIALFTDNNVNSYTLNDNEIAFSIYKDKNGSFYIGEKLEGVVPVNTYAIVFSGTYNTSFAELFMKKDEKINFRNLSAANSSVYLPSVCIKDKTYVINDQKDFSKEGIYVLDCTFEKYATPIFEKDYVCTAVTNGSISFVGEKNKQIVIPNKNSYIVCFVGEEYISLAEMNKKVETMLITPVTDKESEIVLEYSTFSKKLSGVDKTRETDNLIVYTPAYGKYTKTNEWGCEIAVDKNGFMFDFSTAGNMEIPDGGFVISAHGEMIDWLKERYLYGAEVVFDRSGSNIVISVTPLSTVNSVIRAYEIVRDNYDKAIKTYREFDVKSLDELLNVAKQNIDKTNDDDLSVVIESVFSANKAIVDASNLYFSSSTVENRAAWYAPTEKNEAEVLKTIELIKSLNINALYIETWRSGQTIYKTKLDLTFQESRFNGFDVLEAFVRLGHENGIEIHAWVHDFFVGTDYNKTQKGHVLNVHPEWALETRSGSVLNPTGYGNFMFLDPYKRECRDLLLSVYREILENYDVDGLHLDYIRFPEPNSSKEDWGYNDDIIAAFQAEYNTSVDPRTIYSTHSMWNKWCKFREDIITSFVGEVYDLVQEVDPNVWLSAAIYPNMDSTPKTIFQNFVPWVENGWMDEIFAMAYASSADTVIEISNNFLKAINGKCFYSAGIGAFAQYDDVAYLEQIERLRDTTAIGTNIFSLASVDGNNLMKLLQETVYRNKSVQVNDPSSVSLYLKSMIERCDGVYVKSDLSQDDLEELKSILSAALVKVEAIKLTENSCSAKKTYFESLKPIIKSINISDFEDKDYDLYFALFTQIQSLNRLIDTNIKILS